MAGKRPAASDLAAADLVVCVGGPYDGFWFFRDEWDQRTRASARMAEISGGTRQQRDVLYRETGRTVPNPAHPGVIGMELVPE